jgi:hypothetical protein
MPPCHAGDLTGKHESGRKYHAKTAGANLVPNSIAPP